RLNQILRRKGKVWSDRHHRRDLESPSEVRNTLLYVLQNHRRHGVKTFGRGTLDPYSTAPRFRHWADVHVTLNETEPWPEPTPRTGLLNAGWLRAGGPLSLSEPPRAARTTPLRERHRAQRNQVFNVSNS